MTDLTQNISWFIQGFTGRVLVWNQSGQEVGYRKDTGSNVIYLNPPFVGKIPNGTVLISKDWFGRDVALQYKGAITSTGAPAGSSTVQPVTVTGDQVTAVTTQPGSLTTAIDNLSFGGLKLTTPILVAGGALALYLLMGRSGGSK